MSLALCHVGSNINININIRINIRHVILLSRDLPLSAFAPPEEKQTRKKTHIPDLKHVIADWFDSRDQSQRLPSH
jgi:hypothetical protein